MSRFSSAPRGRRTLATFDGLSRFTTRSAIVGYGWPSVGTTVRPWTGATFSRNSRRAVFVRWTVWRSEPVANDRIGAQIDRARGQQNQGDRYAKPDKWRVADRWCATNHARVIHRPSVFRQIIVPVGFSQTKVSPGISCGIAYEHHLEIQWRQTWSSDGPVAMHRPNAGFIAYFDETACARSAACPDERASVIDLRLEGKTIEGGPVEPVFPARRSVCRRRSSEPK